MVANRGNASGAGTIQASAEKRPRCALITGGTRGIGLGTARAFVQAGLNVVIVGRDATAGAEAAAFLDDEGPGRAWLVEADVRSREDMDRAAHEAIRQFGGLDILCANAGVFPQAKIEDMSEADWACVMDTNLKGVLLAVQSALPYLKASGAGRILLTSSITGPLTGLAGWSHYGATKAGLLGFMRSAAIELAPHAITVNALLPGNILTESLQGLGEDYLTRMRSGIPLGRLGTVEDVGSAALFLASAAASFITGHALVIDGGQTLPEALAETA